MRVARWLALLVSPASFLTCALVVGAQSSSPGEIASSPIPENPEVQDVSARVLRARVLELFQGSQYGQIDALAQQLRSERTRFRGGAWQINVLYEAINSPGSMTASDADWQALITKLQGWVAANQQSPTPRIAMAQAYLTFAWKARGNGLAKTVTQQGWALFNERVQSARITLEEGRSISVDCPEWYRAMQTVALAQGWPRKQVDDLAQAAMIHNPEYYYFALAEANYLLPKWYGRPGDSQAYASRMADAVGGREGDALYFLVAAHLNCCKRIQAPGMDEARLQRGFAAIDQLYGSTTRQRNEAAFLALRAADTTAAQTLFARIGNDWSAAVWGSKARFDASRTGQPLGGVFPVGPAAANDDQSDGASGGR